MTANPSLAATSLARLALAFLALFVAAASAWTAAYFSPGAARASVQPGVSVAPARHNVPAAEGDDAEDDAPEEPQLEFIPVVPVDQPQSLAV